MTIRKVMYTTNAIESLNMSLRKIIKTRGSFPSALKNVAAKWKRNGVVGWRVSSLCSGGIGSEPSCGPSVFRCATFGGKEETFRHARSRADGRSSSINDPGAKLFEGNFRFWRKKEKRSKKERKRGEFRIGLSRQEQRSIPTTWFPIQRSM